MTYEEALESLVTAKQAMRELKAHGIEVRLCESGRLVDHYTGEVIATPNADGLYPGSDLLHWLGY